jgi:hypothetical protein
VGYAPGMAADRIRLAQPAAKLIGLDNAGALTAERDQLEASNQALRMEAVGYKDYAEKLEAAVSAMPPSRAKRQAVKR